VRALDLIFVLQRHANKMFDLGPCDDRLEPCESVPARLGGPPLWDQCPPSKTPMDSAGVICSVISAHRESRNFRLWPTPISRSCKHYLIVFDHAGETCLFFASSNRSDRPCFIGTSPAPDTAESPRSSRDTTPVQGQASSRMVFPSLVDCAARTGSTLGHVHRQMADEARLLATI